MIYVYPVDDCPVVVVANKVAWTPTVAKWFRPLSPSIQRFRARENEILNDPNGDFPPTLRAVTDNTYDKLFKRFTPEQFERTKLGYEKPKSSPSASSPPAASSRKAPIRLAGWPVCCFTRPW